MSEHIFHRDTELPTWFNCSQCGYVTEDPDMDNNGPCSGSRNADLVQFAREVSGSDIKNLYNGEICDHCMIPFDPDKSFEVNTFRMPLCDTCIKLGREILGHDLD